MGVAHPPESDHQETSRLQIRTSINLLLHVSFPFFFFFLQRGKLELTGARGHETNWEEKEAERERERGAPIQKTQRGLTRRRLAISAKHTEPATLLSPQLVSGGCERWLEGQSCVGEGGVGGGNEGQLSHLATAYAPVTDVCLCPLAADHLRGPGQKPGDVQSPADTRDHVQVRASHAHPCFSGIISTHAPLQAHTHTEPNVLRKMSFSSQSCCFNYNVKINFLVSGLGGKGSIYRGL